jgi:hypothetical protein
MKEFKLGDRDAVAKAINHAILTCRCWETCDAPKEAIAFARLTETEEFRAWLATNAGDHDPQGFADALEAIRSAVRAAPRGPGRPETHEDLIDAIASLLELWRVAKGEPTCEWHRQEPLSPAACFVHRVMTTLAPRSAPKLPHAMRKALGKTRV